MMRDERSKLGHALLWCSLAIYFSSSHAGFKTMPEKSKTAEEVWGINSPRGNRVASEKASTMMTIDTREDHLNKTVTPRIPSIQNNRELLRTMPTCFDPHDPARISWYGNVEEDIAAAPPSGGSTITKSATWSFTASLRGYEVTPPEYTVTADFHAETAGYSLSSIHPVYEEGDPTTPSCTPFESMFGTCPTFLVISLTFSSTISGVSPLDACAYSGVSFSYDVPPSGSLFYPNVSITQVPTCSNGMTLGMQLKQSFYCIIGTDPDIDCQNPLQAVYKINASWEETTTAPPPEAGTVLHKPVVYGYDPKECSSPP